MSARKKGFRPETFEVVRVQQVRAKAPRPFRRSRRRRKEGSIEESCRVLAQDRGWTSRKMNGLGFRDWPDRIFLPPVTSRRGRRFWAEFKRPGEEPTPAQAKMHRNLRARGEEVWVLDNKEDFEKVMRAHE